LVLLNHISVCLLCTRRRARGRGGSEEEGEEEKEEGRRMGGGEGDEDYIHGRCHKTRDIDILPGLKFG
jgi:hypothetical protein